MNLKSCYNTCIKIVSFWLFCVIDVNRVTAAWDVEDFGIIKILGKFLSVKSCGRDEKFEVWTGSSNIFDQTKEDVGVEGSFMSFVNH